MSFSTILFTEKGRALQAKALSGATLQFTNLVMGSGNLGGQSPITLNALIEPKAVLPITSIKRSSNHVTIKGNFNNSDITTGFYWREIGVYAQDPDIGEILYCYGNAGTLAEYIPPQTSEIIEKAVKLSVIVGAVTNVTAIMDESLIFVTKPELEEVRSRADEAFQYASDGKKKIKDAITGIDPEVIIPNDATFQQLATAIEQIETGVDTTDATATAEYLLANLTAYVKGAKVTGSMPNRGAVNQSLAVNGTYTIPVGYHNGSGKVTQSITTKGAQTYTPSTADQSIAANQYLTGVQTVKGDANLVPANILSGKSIFGVNGGVSIGKKFASGISTVIANTGSNPTPWFWSARRVEITRAASFSASGLGFIPSVIIAFTNGGNGDVTIYNAAPDYAGNTHTVKTAEYSGGSSTTNTNVTTYNYCVNVAGADGQVNSSGFLLPIKTFSNNSGQPITWYAWE